MKSESESINIETVEKLKNDEISLVRKAIEGVIKYQRSVAEGEVSEVF